jgi:hypothetical protein
MGVSFLPLSLLCFVYVAGALLSDAQRLVFVAGAVFHWSVFQNALQAFLKHALTHRPLAVKNWPISYKYHIIIKKGIVQQARRDFWRCVGKLRFVTGCQVRFSAHEKRKTTQS